MKNTHIADDSKGAHHPEGDAGEPKAPHSGVSENESKDAHSDVGGNDAAGHPGAPNTGDANASFNRW